MPDAPSPCPLPPPGWSCSRPAGHDGPCAADRVAVDEALVAEAERLLVSPSELAPFGPGSYLVAVRYDDLLAVLDHFRGAEAADGALVARLREAEMAVRVSHELADAEAEAAAEPSPMFPDVLDLGEIHDLLAAGDVLGAQRAILAALDLVARTEPEPDGAAPSLEAQVYVDADGLHRWRLRSAGNHEILASGEAYATRHDAARAVALVAGPEGERWAHGPEAGV